MPQQAGLRERLRSVNPDFIDKIEHDRTVENGYAARLRHAEGNDRAQRELQAAKEAHLWPFGAHSPSSRRTSGDVIVAGR